MLNTTFNSMNPATRMTASINLSDVPNGGAMRLEGMDVDADVFASLDAMGLAVGDVATVIRRAAFGGPLHVRTSCGAEFAVSRSVASSIRGILVAECSDEHVREGGLAMDSTMGTTD